MVAVLGTAAMQTGLAETVFLSLRGAPASRLAELKYGDPGDRPALPESPTEDA